MEAWKSQSCSWCKKFDNAYEEFTDDHHRNEETFDDDVNNDESKNEWYTIESSIESSINGGTRYFPLVRFNKDENQKIRGFGIQGN